MSEKTPEFWMRRAIELAQRGFPAPNPHVGCVIVRDGAAVGEGWHNHAGGAHAEVMALNQAGERASGAEVFVTLEPCNHHGRTGPCAEALLAAGIRRVFYACTDPNPKAKGGAQRLREGGAEAEGGLLHDEAFAVNRVWLTAMQRQRPYVCVKAAVTLDGRIALPSGESQWITSSESRDRAHAMRAEMGAVLVGSGTALADDPQMTARIGGVENQPARVLLDPERALSGSESAFSPEGGPTHWFVSKTLSDGPQIGLDVREGEFDLNEVMSELWARGITSVLVEGGGVTIASFLRAGLVDRIDLFIAPKLFGAGRSWVSGALAERLSEVGEWRFEEPASVGPDIWLRAYPS